MKLALMQPYFFPYLGYYTIMKHVDYYVYFDTAQYMKGGWINRNRILKPDGVDWQYITVPLENHSYKAKIKDVKVNYNLPVLERVVGKLEHYKKKAPYYNEVLNLLKEALQRKSSISELNIGADNLVCDYLGINPKKYILSEGNLDCKEAKSADEWGLNACLAAGNISEYWNAPGGAEFYNQDKYRKSGIQICFVKNNLRNYLQKFSGEPFVSGLSILDVMMFNSPKEINDMLDDYEIL